MPIAKYMLPLTNAPSVNEAISISMVYALLKIAVTSVSSPVLLVWMGLLCLMKSVLLIIVKPLTS